MILAGLGFGCAPAAFADDRPALDDQGDISPKPIDGTAPATNGRPEGQNSQPQPGETEKDKLAVNPVTGMAVLSGKHYVPLTGKERWDLYWKQNYLSVGEYFGPVMTSLLLDQVSNSPTEWGGGFRGYGRRLASRTGGAMVQGTVQALVAPVLHEDVRYIPSEDADGKHRILHAIAYSFLAYNRKGRPVLNIANLGAYYASTAISTQWLPRKDSVAWYTLTNGSVQIALIMPVNILQEFWPDLIHKIRQH
jgi:hypothetical protein